MFHQVQNYHSQSNNETTENESVDQTVQTLAKHRPGGAPLSCPRKQWRLLPRCHSLEHTRRLLFDAVLQVGFSSVTLTRRTTRRNKCPMTATLTIRLDKRELGKIDRAAGKLTRTEWVRRVIRREINRPRRAGWAEHFDWLEKRGRVVRGHPDDELRSLNR
jgi:hypothetical protein